jgi:hypothetical protein
MLRVEVTTGWRSERGTLSFAPHDSSKYDVLAIVTESEIDYRPRWE